MTDEPAAADTPAPAQGSAGHAALAAAGEAAAFIAGAPIAGAADGAIDLGDRVAGREAQLEAAIGGAHAPGATSGPRQTWIWVLLGLLVIGVAAWLANR